MNSYKMVKQVKRKPKAMSGLLRKIMIVFSVIFILLGIMISQGFMLPGFLLVALYFLYSTMSQKEYEYTLENNELTISVIQGRRHRKTAHTLYLKDLEVVAPNRHEAVAKYRKKGGTEKLPKFDYTSYDDDIPYFTMIIMEGRDKIKLLLDLDDEMLQSLKRAYPERVFLA